MVKIRPRIFLEGNYFLDLDPGSPSAPELASGATIPITQTATAVQFDEILTALQAPQRQQLGRLLEGYGTALTHKPTAAEDVTQDPQVQGLSAAEALNRSFDYGGKAGRAGSQVAEALLGTEPDDLSRLIAGQRQDVRGAVGSRAAAPRPGEQLEHASPGRSRPSRTTSAAPSRTCRRRFRPPAARSPTSAARCRSCGAGRSSSAVARRAARDHRRREPLARPGRAAALQAGGRRPASSSCARHAGPRGRQPGRAHHAAADRPAQPLHELGAGADRQPGDRRPLLDRPAELPRVLLHDGEPGGREPELRRQRRLPAAAARRRAT